MKEFTEKLAPSAVESSQWRVVSFIVRFAEDMMNEGTWAGEPNERTNESIDERRQAND